MPCATPFSKTPEFQVTDEDLLEAHTLAQKDKLSDGPAKQVQESMRQQKKTLKSDYGKRASKLTAIIDAKLGPSAAEVHRFNTPLLVQQALKILKLEDSLAENQRKQPTSHSYFLPTIIAACCYIQTKQSQKW